MTVQDGGVWNAGSIAASSGSWRSGDETPVCNVIGATSTPRATSAVISSGVNGRPALGISALPGVVA